MAENVGNIGRELGLADKKKVMQYNIKLDFNIFQKFLQLRKNYYFFV